MEPSDHAHDNFDRKCDTEAILREATRLTRNIRRDIAGAVHELSHPRIDTALGLLRIMVKLTLKEPRLYRAGAHRAYIKLALRNYNTASEPSYTYLPLEGLLNVLLCIRDKDLFDRDDTTLVQIRESLHFVSAAILRVLPFLTSAASNANRFRDAICHFMTAFYDIVPEGPKYMRDDEASIFIAIQCWLNMSPAAGSPRRRAQVLVRRLLTDVSSQDSQSAVDRVVNAFPVSSLVHHVSAALADPKMINTALVDELNIVVPFLTTGHPAFVTFLDTRFYDSLSKAVRRQFKSGKRERSAAANKAAAHLMDQMFGAPKISPPHYTMMIQGTDVLAVAAQGLVIAQHKESNEWLSFFGRLSHVIGGCPEPLCPWQPPPGFFEACRQKMEPIYFRTCRALRRLGPLGAQGLEVFETFSGLLRVTEEALQTKWRESHECCNPLCELREQERAESIKKCKACGPDNVVYYHGQTCQKADWRRHRTECGRSPS